MVLPWSIRTYRTGIASVPMHQGAIRNENGPMTNVVQLAYPLLNSKRHSAVHRCTEASIHSIHVEPRRDSNGGPQTVNHRRVTLQPCLCDFFQRTGQRGRLAEDGIEESLHVRRDRRPLSAEASVRSGLLRSRIPATHGPWEYPLSVHALRKWSADTYYAVAKAPLIYSTKAYKRQSRHQGLRGPGQKSILLKASNRKQITLRLYFRASLRLRGNLVW